jgi:hypothetical protein
MLLTWLIPEVWLVGIPLLIVALTPRVDHG